MLVGPADRSRGGRRHGHGARPGTAAGRHGSRRRPRDRRRPRGGFYVRPAIVEIAPIGPDRAGRNVRTDPLFSATITTWTRPSHIHNRVPQGLSSAIFTQDVGEAELFRLPGRFATAASRTSTSAPAGRKSAGPSAAKKPPAAAASPAPTPGKPTCAAPRIRSTTPATCRWHKAFGLTFDREAGGRGGEAPAEPFRMVYPTPQQTRIWSFIWWPPKIR